MSIPIRHVDQLIPLMAEGLVLPYLDIPFQHASPAVLKRMRRPANEAKVLERLAGWRDICPDITVRSTFIVGYPARRGRLPVSSGLDGGSATRRVGCFQYENVRGASANDLPDHVPEALKQERWERFMETAQRISAAKLAAKVAGKWT